MNVKQLKEKALKCVNYGKKHIEHYFKKTVRFCCNNKILVFIIFLSCFLIFSGITNRALWRDEAGTAIIGRNVLTTGLPTVYDGKNLVVTDFNDYNKDYMSTKPPLQYYVIAGSFFIFGTNTFAARLPFAIFGVLTVFFTYFVALKLTSNKKIALTSTLLLAISVFFIVHSRNARYYSMSAFFTVLTTYFYLNFLKEKRDKFKLVVSSSLLFYTSPLVFLSLMLSFAIHYPLVLKKSFFKKEKLKNIFIILTLVFIITFPYYLYATQISPPLDAEPLLSFDSSSEKISENMGIYLTTIYQIIPKILLIPNILLLFFIIPFLTLNNIVISIRKRKNLLRINYSMIFVLLFIFFNLLFFSMFDFAFGAQPRFITGVVPFLFIFSAIAIFKISKSNLFIVAILIFILFFALPLANTLAPDLEDNWIGEYGETREFNENSNPFIYKMAQDLLVTSKTPHYIYAIIKEYSEPFQDGTYEVSNYLILHGTKNDIVYCTDYPLVRNLMFTTDMQIYPFSLSRQRYKELFPNEKPCFIISGVMYKTGNVDEEWEEYANSSCEAINLTIHKPFKAWDANRPSFGIDSYYYEPDMINITIYKCPCSSQSK